MVTFPSPTRIQGVVYFLWLALSFAISLYTNRRLKQQCKIELYSFPLVSIPNYIKTPPLASVTASSFFDRSKITMIYLEPASWIFFAMYVPSSVEFKLAYIWFLKSKHITCFMPHPFFKQDLHNISFPLQTKQNNQKDITWPICGSTIKIRITPIMLATHTLTYRTTFHRQKYNKLRDYTTDLFWSYIPRWQCPCC